MNKPSPLSSNRRGFSLTELLVVIAIMSILLATSMPSMNSLLENNNITQGGQLVADQFSVARQLASVRNRTVEVRLLRRTQTTSSSTRYSAIQIWAPNATTGTMTAAGRMIALPQNIVISEDNSFSPFLQKMTSGTMPSTAGTLANTAYRAFRIRPNGIIEPVPGTTTDRSQLFFTVVNTKYATASNLPANYATVQINPDTGSTQIFRP